MIKIVEGVLGGGKTVFAVRDTLERLRDGGYVYTNVEMVRPAVRSYLLSKYGVYLRSDQLREFPATEGVKGWVEFMEWGTLDSPVLAIIDESQMFYNSRDWAKTQEHDRDMLSFLTQSRKAGVDVTFISQSSGNIDKQFRVLAECTVKARNMKHIKAPLLGVAMSGFFFYQWTETATNHVFDSKWWKADKGVFACYRTAAFLDSLMQEMASTKERLEARPLRSAPSIVRLAHRFQPKDGIEKFFSKLLRRAAAAKLLKQRKQDNENSNRARNPGCRGVRGLLSLESDKLVPGRSRNGSLESNGISRIREYNIRELRRKRELRNRFNRRKRAVRFQDSRSGVQGAFQVGS